MATDPLAPLTRRLRQMTKDANNIVTNTLILFVGIREQKKPREEVKTELFRLKAQFARLESAFGRYNDLLEALEGHAGELNEADLIALVEKIGDAGTIAEHTGAVLALDYVASATRLLNTRPERMIEIVREMDKSGGREQVWAFCKAAIDYYQALPEPGKTSALRQDFGVSAQSNAQDATLPAQEAEKPDPALPAQDEKPDDKEGAG